MGRNERLPQVTVTTASLWRLRIRRDATRYLLAALSAAGLAASARYAIAPPIPVVHGRAPALAESPDRAAEAYAALFARRYLTWSAADPRASEAALEPFLGPGIEPDAGLELPAGGEQRVEWVEVVQAREPRQGEHVYTLAVQTDSAGLLYLTVPVRRLAGGSLALAGYPAFAGAPQSAPAQATPPAGEVQDQALVVVVQRALRNYLADSGAELSADLSSAARVSLPPMPLALESMQRPQWVAGGGSVLAVVQARDRRGVQYSLGYELDVVRTQGRWEIAAVQTDPDS